jgi:hypothetical protein
MFQKFKIKNLALVFGIFEKISMTFTNNLSCIPPKKCLFPNSYEIKVETQIDKKGLINSKFHMERVTTYKWKIDTM